MITLEGDWSWMPLDRQAFTGRRRRQRDPEGNHEYQFRHRIGHVPCTVTMAAKAIALDAIAAEAIFAA
jgi:hypothetical protein